MADYRVSWTREGEPYTYHSDVFSRLTEAERYRTEIQDLNKEVWIEKADWKIA